MNILRAMIAILIIPAFLLFGCSDPEDKTTTYGRDAYKTKEDCVQDWGVEKCTQQKIPHDHLVTQQPQQNGVSTGELLLWLGAYHLLTSNNTPAVVNSPASNLTQNNDKDKQSSTSARPSGGGAVIVPSRRLGSVQFSSPEARAPLFPSRGTGFTSRGPVASSPSLGSSGKSFSSSPGVSRGGFGATGGGFGGSGG